MRFGAAGAVVESKAHIVSYFRIQSADKLQIRFQSKTKHALCRPKPH